MFLLAENLSHLMQRNPVLHVVSSWIMAIVLLLFGVKLLSRNVSRVVAREKLPKHAVLFNLALIIGGLVSFAIAILITFVAPRIQF